MHPTSVHSTGKLRTPVANSRSDVLSLEFELCHHLSVMPRPEGRRLAEPTFGTATGLDVLRRQARKAWTWLKETVGDVSAEQANWWPPGTANSIGTTYLHVVINTDVEINRVLIFSREPLVETRWGGDVGQGVSYDPKGFDAWTRHVAVDWEVLRQYGRGCMPSSSARSTT